MSPLTTQAVRVVRVLKDAGRPLTTTAVIDATAGHTFLTWKALKALTARGYIRCATARTAKTGRPSKVYWMEA